MLLISTFKQLSVFWFKITRQGKFMLNSSSRQKKYYVDSIIKNTKRGLCQKVRRSSFAPARYINDSRIKNILVGVALSSTIIFFLALAIPNWGYHTKLASLTRNQSIAFPKTSVFPETRANSGLPVRLKIPGINVDAPLRPVGLTPDGSMDTAKGPDEAVWFEPGPRPGEDGSAVIAGHYGTWKNGEGSVFDNLHELSKGDKLYIEDDEGATISFVVRESRTYNSNADPSDVFSSSDGKSHLNLITCEGVWNKDSKSYSQRLVIFTDKEGD
jgi:LPXTG-site transpeptidase (sortase) family protein